MKYFSLIFAVVFLSHTLVSQTELSLNYKVEMSSDDPEMEAQLSMFQNSSLQLYIKDQMSRQEFSFGGMIKTTVIMNSETQEGLSLIDGMMGNYAAKISPDKEDTISENDSAVDFEIELVDETKKILGYTCKKAIVYDQDGNESVYWYTEEIAPPKEGGKYMNEKVPGMPIEFTVNQQGITMTFTATKFEKKVDKPKEKFSMKVPEGYTEKPLEEIQGMMGGS
ncbi:MAG: hypothetical protein R3277_05695 [Brumimicrobium sp.]|nr:hypothetical protein [Brumimicrobium sp.]